MITAADVRALALSLPRTEEHLIHDHIKFRVGKIVYASISPDETTLGVGFPKEERAAIIAAEPAKFSLPRVSDQRFHWIHARMAAVSPEEMRELVTDAWRMVVPKKVAAAHLGAAAPGTPAPGTPAPPTAAPPTAARGLLGEDQSW
ncbi:MAG: MmcQ/YjbR family DNA-binding protein [Streptosporangiaceae bacterium]|nr:MmcQ/YjbR family DNA-binding protein [Streptosporangiaceae bacterium]MBV9855871.1 MmcQ/YjbR family DNA-binding protein [Streptosporangiaceae bacterium]